MAILNKLRNSSIVLIVILASLLIFVLTDFLDGSNKYNVSGGDAVGEINGTEITVLEFDERYKQLLAQLTQNGQPETDEIRNQASTYAWNQFIQQYVVDKEYDKLGINVSVKESTELLFSDNAHPTIKQYFTGQDGVFSPSNVIAYKNQAKKDPQAMAQFEMVVKQILLEVQNRKYNSLIAKTIYATTLDAEDDFYASSVNVSGKSVTLNYASVDDKTIKITDDELKSYITKHKENFQQKELRDLEYILLNVSPSKDDSLTVRDELASEIRNFATAEDDSLYVNINSTKPFDASFKPRGGFNKDLEARIFNAPKDSVLGPYYYDGGYSLFKITGTKEDSLAYYHPIRVDIPVKGTTKMDTMAAMVNARKLAADSKSATNSLEFFNSKASTGEVSYAYDLGWIREGSQDPEINKALKTLGPGESTVIKTPGGLAIIKLVDPKSNRLVQVGEVRKMVEALKSTEDEAFQKAMNFRNSLTGDKKDEFEALTKKTGFAKSLANNVKESDRTMTGIPGTLEVVRWAFNEDRKQGDYSDVISTENMLLVVHLVRIKKEGTAKVDDVREKVTQLVMNEKKAEKLKAEFAKAMKSSKNIDDVANGVKSLAQSFNGLNFFATTVQFAGNDPKLVGFVCGLKPNVISKPVASSDGVHVFYVENITTPDRVEDLKMRQNMMYSQKKQQVYNVVFEGLKKAKKVTDERFRYY